MNIKKRLEKLETAAEMRTVEHTVTEIILVPFGTISDAARWCYERKEFVCVSDEELKALKKDNK